MPERNWRRAYHTAIDRYTRAWRKWRHEAPSTRIRTPGMLPDYTAGQMVEWSDQELSEFAQTVAARDMERAINMENESAA